MATSFLVEMTIEGYIAVNFEVASSSSFQDFPKRLVCNGEVGDGSDDMNVICNWRDIISGEVADTFQEYV